MRVVIDTNVFVSGLMFPASIPCRILSVAISGSIGFALCEGMLDEIGLALHYPKVRKRIGLSDDELERYLQALRFMTDFVDPVGIVVEVPGDRDDDMILATAIAARADWLITGDSALLALASRYPILTPAEFAARHLP